MQKGTSPRPARPHFEFNIGSPGLGRSSPQMTIPKMRAELLLPSDLCSFDTVSDLEDPLDRRLMDSGVGEVVGGGIASGWYRFDLELSDYDRALELLAGWAEELGLPEGSGVRRAGETAITVVVSEPDGQRPRA